MKEIFITQKYLQDHSNEVFVFGDNTLHKGKGGAAVLRDEVNSLGFITKKYPRSDDEAFYRPSEYRSVFESEMSKLTEKISKNPDKTYLISKLGAGLANRFNIFQEVIEPNIKDELSFYKNVRFLW